MKKIWSIVFEKLRKKLWEVFIAAITAAITALTTTSCMGFGPF